MEVRRVLVLAVLASLAVLPVRAAETAEHWIAKARTYLGSESALKAVTSIRYFGELETTTESASASDKPGPVVRLPAEIAVQKPYQQHITLTKADAIEKKVLDGYDGWARSTSLKDSKQWRFRLLEAQEIKQLRANTWENLNFFAGLDAAGGTVRLEGEATVDGVACVKLAFVHAGDIVFRRYFEQATGRLVKTETENGGEIREEGEITVEGIRFPRKVINRSPTGQVTTLLIDRVVINERIPDSEFAVPALLVN